MSDDGNIGDKAEERGEMWGDALDDTDENDANDATDTVNAMDASSTQHTSDANDASDTDDAMDALDSEWDVDSIRESWQPNSVRLPDSIQDVFASEYKRLDWQLDQVETEFAFTKDRYYKPLVVALGLDALRDLDGEEIADRIEAMEHRELLDES
jgi:hypothetical protein